MDPRPLNAHSLGRFIGSSEPLGDTVTVTKNAAINTVTPRYLRELSVSISQEYCSPVSPSSLAPPDKPLI